MTTVVFSDSHLVATFEPAKFLYLSRFIEPADRVIINGDFWDGYMTHFTDFLNSEWTKLFALLRQKETYYLPGNHDAAALGDPRTRQFAMVCAEELNIAIDGQSYHFEHGHKIAPTMDLLYPHIFQQKIVATAASSLEHAAAWLIGPKYFAVNRPDNMKMKRWQRQHLPAGQILVCGHSHWPELNEFERYINTGYIRHHYGHHLVIESGQHQLIHGRY